MRRSQFRRVRSQRGFTAQWAAIAIGLLIGVVVLAYFIDKKPQVPDSAGDQSLQVNIQPQPQPQPQPPANTPSSMDTTTATPGKNFSHVVTLTTNKGVIKFETYDGDAPKASQNFITLGQKGFYNGVIFHRVIKGFMIQGGDPNCAPVAAQDKGRCGTGGPGYQFADELDPNTVSAKEGYKAGVVAMANSGPNTNGSQFFIMHKDYPLPHSYTIFGKVVSGQDVVDAIANVATDGNDRPTSAVIIQSVTVENK